VEATVATPAQVDAALSEMLTSAAAYYSMLRVMLVESSESATTIGRSDVEDALLRTLDDVYVRRLQSPFAVRHLM
jgi:hypothetical protein